MNLYRFMELEPVVMPRDDQAKGGTDARNAYGTVMHKWGDVRLRICGAFQNRYFTWSLWAGDKLIMTTSEMDVMAKALARRGLRF